MNDKEMKMWQDCIRNLAIQIRVMITRAILMQTLANMIQRIRKVENE